MPTFSVDYTFISSGSEPLVLQGSEDYSVDYAMSEGEAGIYAKLQLEPKLLEMNRGRAIRELFYLHRAEVRDYISALYSHDYHHFNGKHICMKCGKVVDEPKGSDCKVSKGISKEYRILRDMVSGAFIDGDMYLVYPWDSLRYKVTKAQFKVLRPLLNSRKLSGESVYIL